MVAVASFCCWAFNLRLFPSEVGLYISCAVVFFGLGGISLFPATGKSGAGNALKLAISFAIGFSIYATIWSLCWFGLKNTFGEVAGSALGLLAFVVVLKKTSQINENIFSALTIVFFWHTTGYYTGDFLHYSLLGRNPLPLNLFESKETTVVVSRLAWGVFYGLGLGLGLSQILHKSRQT